MASSAVLVLPKPFRFAAAIIKLAFSVGFVARTFASAIEIPFAFAKSPLEASMTYYAIDGTASLPSADRRSRVGFRASAPHAPAHAAALPTTATDGKHSTPLLDSSGSSPPEACADLTAAAVMRRGCAPARCASLPAASRGSAA